MSDWIEGSDAELAAAIRDVELPTLLMVLAELDGDQWLTESNAPAPLFDPASGFYPDYSGGYEEQRAQAVRERALAALVRLRDEGGELPPPPSPQRLKQLLAYSVNGPVEDDYVPMLMEETGFRNRDVDWLEPLRAALAQGAPDDFHVVVVGAGMSGLCAGVKLKEADIDFTILEKNDAVGGTWYENTYPDCGVDTPNHFYSYSFARNADWTGYFSKRDELYQYFERCADDFELRSYIQLSTEVTAMRFDADAAMWEVDSRDASGQITTRRAHLVISAVGQLNRPNIPEFPGLDSFAGEAFHSARWRHDVDLDGKRVAVIGTGCSAVQLVPKTAAKAQELTVFQHSPHWVAPNPDYYRPVAPGLIWALNNIPLYAEFHRARMVFGFADRNWPAVPADPNWEHSDRSMSEFNNMFREILTDYIKEQLGNRQDLFDKCVPEFPPFGKRVIIDNNWYRSLARDNVNLETESITAIRPQGVQTADGQLHEVDVIVFATGFKTHEFLWPMEVAGESGTLLSQRWGKAPNAYKGVLVPDFPNLFCLYGPNQYAYPLDTTKAN